MAALQYWRHPTWTASGGLVQGPREEVLGVRNSDAEISPLIAAGNSENPNKNESRSESIKAEEMATSQTWKVPSFCNGITMNQHESPINHHESPLNTMNHHEAPINHY